MKSDPKTAPGAYNAALPATPPQVIFSMVPLPAKFSEVARGDSLPAFDLLERVNSIRLLKARNAGPDTLPSEFHAKVSACAMVLYGCLAAFEDLMPREITFSLGAGILQFNAQMGENEAPGQEILHALGQLRGAQGRPQGKDIILDASRGMELALFVRSAVVGIPSVEIQQDSTILTILIDSRKILSLPMGQSFAGGKVLEPLCRFLEHLVREYVSSLPPADAGQALAEKGILPATGWALPRAPELFVKYKYNLWAFLGDLHPGPLVGSLTVPAKATVWGCVQTWEAKTSDPSRGPTIVDYPGEVAQALFEEDLITRLGSPCHDGHGPAHFLAPPSKVVQGINASLLAHIKAANATRVFYFNEVPPSGAYAGIKGKARPGFIYLKTENPLGSSRGVTYISTRRDVVLVTSLAGISVTFTNGAEQRDFSYNGLDALVPLLASPAELILLKKKVLAAGSMADYARRRLNIFAPPTGERAPAPYYVYTRDVPVSPASTKRVLAWDPFLKRAKIPGIVMRVSEAQLIPPLIVRGDFDFKRGSDFQRVTKIPPEGLDLAGVKI